MVLNQNNLISDKNYWNLHPTFLNVGCKKKPNIMVIVVKLLKILKNRWCSLFLINRHVDLQILLQIQITVKLDLYAR